MGRGEWICTPKQQVATMLWNIISCLPCHRKLQLHKSWIFLHREQSEKCEYEAFYLCPRCSVGSYKFCECSQLRLENVSQLPPSNCNYSPFLKKVKWVCFRIFWWCQPCDQCLGSDWTVLMEQFVFKHLNEWTLITWLFLKRLCSVWTVSRTRPFKRCWVCPSAVYVVTTSRSMAFYGTECHSYRVAIPL